MKKYIFIFLMFILMSCSSSQTITLATTTSLQDSGLLDSLIPEFEKDTGIKVKVIARGTGEALEIAKRGDADLLFVHSKEKEEEFIKRGYGLKRIEIMYNDFLIVGPPRDPANIKNLAYNDPIKAFKLIYENKAKFISRGDESGTHQREKKIWQEANIDQKWENYIDSGLGMGQVLNMASEKGAYTLTDRATYITMKNSLNLDVLSQNSSLLINQYSIVLLNPNKIHHNYDLAKKFVDWILSDKGQKIIKEYGLDKYGQPLFNLNKKR
ncbi:tungstate transport system substrate-binding protein [Caloramator fervidus]|uniref:Tungstate transport system substrate-binding protein n=1 Tax=Caloramator fervidus TaxID=29344 RepID=A0A1H5WAG3_9CLOT|nr:extracellular solute-binding protein [Caloramator fervidus]SEF96549.1 tungstate transport system substrate-binding protein [Caloramator fervidus]